jgi:hypothetical protein
MLVPGHIKHDTLGGEDDLHVLHVGVLQHAARHVHQRRVVQEAACNTSTGTTSVK